MLTQKEIDSLEKDGFLNLGPLLNASQVKEVNEAIDALLNNEGEKAGSELFDSKYIRHPTEDGVDRLADLVNKGSVFDQFYTHPKVLAAIETVLGKAYKLSSLNYRAAKPGKGLQKLHVDWGNTVVNGDYQVCNTIWLLDDFVENNGATRIVPGSHKRNELPNDVLEDPLAPHPDEILIQAPAGSVVIFNSHVWHGGTTNHTTKDRRSIHSYFCNRSLPQQVDQQRYITSETKERIGEKGMYILDVK
ncbi:MAG: phytanoyl-CoA dioxygenase family protein [Cytophagales bacterium]|nr:phytanoyl-CoA dioxygenase family protein [Cytophagales bacterium]